MASSKFSPLSLVDYLKFYDVTLWWKADENLCEFKWSRTQECFENKNTAKKGKENKTQETSFLRRQRDYKGTLNIPNSLAGARIS